MLNSSSSSATSASFAFNIRSREAAVDIGGKTLSAMKSILCLFVLMIYCAACAHSNSAQKERESNMNEEKDIPVVYTALGDSTGVGTGAKEGGGYVLRLFKRIESEHPQSRLTNFCVSGATTEDILRGQIGEAINSRPTLVTLGIGINDIGHGMDVDRFARNYEEIISRLKRETTASVVVTNIPDISFAPVVFESQRAATRRTVELFNERIHSIAKRYEVAVVDTFTETHNMIPTHPEFFSEDGFHPSDAGYEYWEKTMWPAVKHAIDQRR